MASKSEKRPVKNAAVVQAKSPAKPAAEKKIAEKKAIVKKAESKKNSGKEKAAASETKLAKTTSKKSPVVPAAVKKTVAKAETKAAVKKESEKPKEPVEIKSEKKTMKKVSTKKEEVKAEQPAAQKEVAGHSVVEITSPKKVVKKIKGYSKEDLEYFKKIILEKRNEIIEQLQNLREQMMDPTTGQYVNESSPYSLHMAEQGTDAMEREKIFLWAQRENKFLGYLDDALHRIENGTYGICLECIDEPQNLCPTCPLIARERLAAVPHSQLCLPVKAKQEKR